MSYWYERITKKHIIVLIIGFIPLGHMNNARAAMSYIGGAIATASRTLMDWLAVDYPITHFEVIPNVHMPMEDGCIEWLGFSSCEHVQFKDWMQILTEPELLSINLYNITDNAGKEFAALPAINAERTYADAGTLSAGGSLYLALTSNTKLLDTENLQSQVVIPNLAAVAGANNQVAANNLLSKVTMASLLGEGGAYFNAGKGGKSQVYNVPAKGTGYRKYTSTPFKLAGVKALYYLTSVGDDQTRCWDQGCASGCAWSTTCEPLAYSHDGTVMPCGNLFMNYAAAGFAQLPIVPWSYREYVGADIELRKSVAVFDPEIFVSTEYAVTAEEPDATAEKYPGVKVWSWEAQGLIPTCAKPSLIEGKDCDSPKGFVNVDFASSLVPTKFTRILYVSMPEEAKPVIKSEIVSGLRLDYVRSWQMNAKINGEMMKMFWISSRPAGIVATPGGYKATDKFTESFQNYGAEMIVLQLVAGAATCLFLGAAIALLLYASSCIDFWNNISKTYEQVNYI